MSFLFDYMCTRLPFISWSIAAVPSSQALPGYLITAPPSVCVPVVSANCVDSTTKKKTEDERLEMVIAMQNEILIGIMKLLF